jgi:hypothetical protein
MRMLRYFATPCVLFSLVLVFRTTPTVGASFDFDHGNAAIEVVIPAAISGHSRNRLPRRQ